MLDVVAGGVDPPAPRDNIDDTYLSPKNMKNKKSRRTKLRAMVIEFKNRPCMDCGGRFPYYVMQLDHREPETKNRKVSDMWHAGTQRQMEEELPKCDVVCANCHAARTFERKHYLYRDGQPMTVEDPPQRKLFH